MGAYLPHNNSDGIFSKHWHFISGTRNTRRCRHNKLKWGWECLVQTSNKKSSLNLISDRGSLKNGRGRGTRGKRGVRAKNKSRHWNRDRWTVGNEILCGIAVPQKMHRLDFSPRRGPRDGGNDFLQHSPGIYRSFSGGICCNCPLFENFNFLDLRRFRRLTRAFKWRCG